MTAETGARVCVVIVSFNSEDTFDRCLACLEAQTYRDFAVLVIDNASYTSPQPLIEALSIPVKFMTLEKNTGFAGAMAHALAETRSPLLVTLNPDAFAQPDWLTKLVAAADAHPETAAFGSRQRMAESPDQLDGYGDHYLVTGQAWRGRREPAVVAPDGVTECFGVCAAAALYRTDALRIIGGFDPSLFCFYEDIDVSFRFRLAGYGCAVVDDAIVDHVGGASYAGRPAFAARLIARNQWRVLIKAMPAALLPIALAGFAVIHFVGALRNPTGPASAGLWDGMLETAQAWKARRTVVRRVSMFEVARWLTWSPGAFRRKESPVRFTRQ